MIEEYKLMGHQNKSLSIYNENLKTRNEILEKNELSNIKKIDRPLTKYDTALKEFILDGNDISKLASMIYGVSINNGEGIGFATESPFKKVQIPMKTKKAPCSECIQKGMYSHFVLDDEKAKVMNKSETENSESKVLIKSKPKILELKIQKSSESKPEKNSRPNIFIAKVLNNSKPCSLRLKVIKIQNSFRTNPKGPLKIWVHKCDIVRDVMGIHGYG